jgi:antitoxin CptB
MPEINDARPAGKTDSMDIRRKKLLFRCWHRGMREMDMLLGKFAEQRIDDFSDDELAQLEEILTYDDPVIYEWIAKDGILPESLQHELMDSLKKFTLSISSY